MLPSASAHAEAGVLPPPLRCVVPPQLGPAGGTTIPANNPAFLFEAAIFNQVVARPIDAVALVLREEGGAEIPIALEPLTGSVVPGYQQGNQNERYLIRPRRTLTPGPVYLGFNDDCGPVGQVRREYRYTVGPAQPLPTRLGTPRQTDPGIVDPACGLRTAAFVVDLSPELAAFPLIRLEVRAPDGRWLTAGVRRQDPGRLEGSLLVACSAAMEAPSYLHRGETEVTLLAEVLGAPPLPPITLAITSDCARDAGCEKPDAATDRGPLAGDDTRAPPDGPDFNAAEDGVALPADAGGANLAGGACSCRVGGRAQPGLWLAAAVTLTWVRRRRTASRTRPDRPDRCTRSAG
jgi:hypothetical protein